MVGDWLPDLPFDKYYRYLASIGTLLVFLSLFVPTVILSNRVVLEMGAVAVVFGILGWLFELLWQNYIEGMNTMIPDIMTKIPAGNSPYDYMSIRPNHLPWLMFGTRLGLFIGFVATEAYIYGANV